MKAKRLLALMLVFTLLGASTLFATEYERYTAKKVSIKVNGTTLDAYGLDVDIKDQSGEFITKTMIPLDDLAKSIGGFVSVKNNVVSINKPNVQLSLLQADDWKPYGLFIKGVKYELYLFAQIDSLYTNISSLKATILDPFGDEVLNVEQEVNQSKESFHNLFKPTTIIFKYNGKYTVNLYMKASNEKEYVKISQIVVESTTDIKK
jgi:hypothetical protein